MLILSSDYLMTISPFSRFDNFPLQIRFLTVHFGATMKTSSQLLITISILLLFGHAPAKADFLVIGKQVGPDVVFTGSGTLNLNDLSFLFDGFGSAGVFPADGGVSLGDDPLNFVDVDIYSGVTSFHESFGPGPGGPADLGTGPRVGFGYADPLNTFLLTVPDGYSGGMLESTSTFLDTDFATLGITPGVYNYSWGSGQNADTITMILVPEPGSLGLMVTVAGVAVNEWLKPKTKAIDPAISRRK